MQIGRFFVLVIALCTFTAPAMAGDASTFCLYSILLEAHAMTSHCDNPLEPAGEGRYIQLRAAMRKFIVENEHLGKHAVDNPSAMLSKYEEATQSRYRTSGDAICKSQTYLDAQRMLRSLTSEKSLSAILEGLKTPNDPFAGECL